VTIRASSAKEVDALIADLNGSVAIAREAAVARLTVIGPRAVERLLGVVRSSAAPIARVSALRALEGIRDPRPVEPALEMASSDTDNDVAAAAISLVRMHIRQARGTSVVERLTQIALDAGRADTVRLAAITALKDLPERTVAPLLQTLANDPKASIRAGAERATSTPRPSSISPSANADADAFLVRSADEGLADDGARLREALASASRTTPLTALLRIVERAREREGMEPAKRRESWTAVRAAAHLALAKRRSRIGLYDLREWLESSETAPTVDAYAALSLVGDASCLEAIARRYAAPQDEWSKSRLGELFRTIVRRDDVSRRTAAVKRIERKQKRVLDELWPAPVRATGRRPPRRQ
jgi:hypothetical protein